MSDDLADGAAVSSVTVIIATHDRLVGLALLLGDLSGQVLDEDVALDVIVVDSPAASLDSAPVVEQAREAGLSVKRLVGDNVLAAKRNLGARATTADLLVFLDDDMRVGPGFVTGHLRAHAERARSVVSGAVVFPEDQVRSSNYYRFKNGRHMNSGEESSSEVPPHRIVAMNMSVPRRDYLDIGGSDEAFVFYGAEDLEFGLRCRKEGLALAYAPAALAEHHEVRMSPSRYLHKVYTAAYRGFPLVLAKHPEARSIATVQLSHVEFASGKFRWISWVVRALSRPTLLRVLGRWLDATDRTRLLHSPLVFKVATILANGLAAKDVAAGQPSRDADWRLAG